MFFGLGIEDWLKDGVSPSPPRSLMFLDASKRVEPKLYYPFLLFSSYFISACIQELVKGQREVTDHSSRAKTFTEEHAH